MPVNSKDNLILMNKGAYDSPFVSVFIFRLN